MKLPKLSEENYEFYAIKFYNNPRCVNIQEFCEDMERIVYLKKWFKKYKDEAYINERLVLNHLIVLYNVFGIQFATKLLLLKIDPEYHSILKTFLIYLNYLKPNEAIHDYDYDWNRVALDQGLQAKLRNI
jgi:hypothetical protein